MGMLFENSSSDHSLLPLAFCSYPRFLVWFVEESEGTDKPCAWRKVYLVLYIPQGLASIHYLSFHREGEVFSFQMEGIGKMFMWKQFFPLFCPMYRKYFGSNNNATTNKMLFSLQIGCCHYLGEGDLNTDFISGQPCSHSTDCRNRRSHLVETAKELINRQGDENNRMDKCAFLITPNPVNALNSCPGMMASISLCKIRRTLSFIYEIVQTQALCTLRSPGTGTPTPAAGSEPRTDLHPLHTQGRTPRRTCLPHLLRTRES